MRKEYLILDKLQSSIVELSGVKNVANGDIVNIKAQGKNTFGKVIKLDGNNVTIQVFGDTQGYGTENTRLSFTAKPLELPMSSSILGRTFNGLGEPIDMGGDVYSDKFYNVNGMPINPVSREYSVDFIQTGISAIDGLMTLIRGQKLPMFSGSGLPHNRICAQIIRQAKLKTNDDFCFVFAAMGIKKDDYLFFEDTFKKAGVKSNVVMYVNMASDPVMERIITPKCALTAAEYLAYQEHKHVLVVMTDMTSYGEALREVSSLKQEVPSRKGYPGYLYSDLASLYERAGMLKGVKGSVTLIPILSMPNDDITHPIPDLTGYITEGQIVISRDLDNQNIYPPINVLPSLSRLMKDGIGANYTREDHEDLMNQLFSAYSKAQEVKNLSQILGVEDLSENDKKYLDFNEAFENQFLSQGEYENRDINQTLDLGWKIIKLLPDEALTRLSPTIKEKYLK